MHKNICIYFSDTGGGHRSAAEAVEGGLRRVLEALPNRGDYSILKENIAERTHPINRFFVEVYNWFLRYHQPLMQLYYDVLHVIKPNDSIIGFLLSEPYMKKLLLSDDPAIVVSVHPMINHILAWQMKREGMTGRVKLVVIITDPNADLWESWACKDTDLYIAPNDIVEEKLVGWGVDRAKIKVIGMPTNLEFLRPPLVEREKFLTHLGLDPRVMTVCLNAGWAGGGNMLKVYAELARAKRPVQAIFLCGHNSSLYEEAVAAAGESEVPTAVLPFHDCMSDLMASVDLMVTKAGGLTTFEAVARRLPMALDVLTKPMPQERGTIDLLCDAGLAQPMHQPSDIITIVENLAIQPDRLNRQLPQEHSLDRTDAVYGMAKLILEACDPQALAQAMEHPELRDLCLQPVMPPSSSIDAKL